MKKLLALVLALVMTLGLATVSTSADYSDQADINYEEAVAVMSAIGIFEGKSGAFDPNANLNRAEAAKVVAYLMVGNKTAENLKGTGTKFTDVPASHWASGYIEYLASVGVVSGVGDNKFDPNGQVTAIQLAKMLLVALGYDAKIEGMVGSDWSINIQKLANKVGIFDGNSNVVGTAAVTRDEAALYGFNTICSPLVEYDNNVTVDLNGNGSVTVGRNKAEYVLSGKPADQKISDEQATVNGATNYMVEFAERYYDKLELDGLDFTFDDFGRPSHTWLLNNQKIGTYVAQSQKVAEFTEEVTAKMLYGALGSTVYDSLCDGNTSLISTVDGARVTSGWINGAANIDPYVHSKNTTTVNNTGNGSLTQVFMNDDKDVIISTVNTYVFKASADYSASQGTLLLEAAGDTNLTLNSFRLDEKDFPEIKDWKADDYILVTAYTDRNGTTNRYDVDTVAKAELVTGEVESLKENNNVTIDGTTYKYSNTTVSGSTDTRKTSYSVGQKATVVLDKYGYIIAVDEAVVAENYVFIANIVSTTGLNTDAVASAYFTDGTKGEITIKKLLDTTNSTKIVNGTSNQTAVGVLNKGSDRSKNSGWYTYSKDSDGKYTLYAIENGYYQEFYLYDTTVGTANIPSVAVGGQVAYLKATDAVGGAATNAEQIAATSLLRSAQSTVNQKTNASTIKTNDKTIFVVEDDGDVYVYTGIKNAPDISLTYDATTPGKAAVAVAYKGDTGFASYVFVTLEGKYAVDDGANEALLYILKQEGRYKHTDNEYYRQIKVVDVATGKDIIVKADDDVNATASAKTTGDTYRAYYKVRKNSDGWYTGLTKINDVKTGSGATNESYAKTTSAYVQLENATDFNYKDGALSIFAAADGGSTANTTYNFTIADDLKINVIALGGDAGGSATAMMTDKKATKDFEIYQYTAKSLDSIFDQYTSKEFDVQLRLKDNWTSATGKNEIVEAYVTVWSVQETVVATTASAINQAFANGSATVNQPTLDLVVDNDINVGTDDTLTVRDLTVNTGKTVTINGTVTVNGTLDVDGHITVNNGATLTVGGATITGPHTISGNSLVVEDGATVTLTAKQGVVVDGKLTLDEAVTINGGLTLKSGANVTVNDDLTIKDAAGTGKGDVVIESGATAVIDAAIDANEFTSDSTAVTLSDNAEITAAGDIVFTAKPASVSTSATIDSTSGDVIATDSTIATEVNKATVNDKSGDDVAAEVKDPDATTVAVKLTNKAVATVSVTIDSDDDYNGTSGSIRKDQSKSYDVTKEDGNWGFTVTWGDVPTIAQVVWYMDGTSQKVIEADGSTYWVPVGEAELEIFVGIPTTTLTLAGDIANKADTAVTIAWAADAGTGDKLWTAQAAASTQDAGGVTSSTGTKAVIPTGAKVTITAIKPGTGYQSVTLAAALTGIVAADSDLDAAEDVVYANTSKDTKLVFNATGATATANVAVVAYGAKLTVKAATGATKIGAITVASNTGDASLVAADAENAGVYYTKSKDTAVKITVAVTPATGMTKVTVTNSDNLTLSAGDATPNCTVSTNDVTMTNDKVTSFIIKTTVTKDATLEFPNAAAA